MKHMNLVLKLMLVIVMTIMMSVTARANDDSSLTTPPPAVTDTSSTDTSSADRSDTSKTDNKKTEERKTQDTSNTETKTTDTSNTKEEKITDTSNTKVEKTTDTSSTTNTNQETVKEPMMFKESTEDKSVTVKVEAEAGAFPEGATMKVEPVEDKEVIDAIKEAVNKESTNKETKSVTAVDITFYDQEGNEIEPAEGSKVSVTMTSDDVKKNKDPVIVHVIDNNKDKEKTDKKNKKDKDKEEYTGEIVEDINTDKKKKGHISFDTDSFSIYAIVEVSETQGTPVTDEASLDGQKLYIHGKRTDPNKPSQYLKNTLDKQGNTDVIAKTTDIAYAQDWTFNRVSADSNLYTISYVDDDGHTIYMGMDRSGNMSLSETVSLLAVIRNDTIGCWEIKDDEVNRYLNEFNNTNGKGFAGWTSGSSSDDGSRMYFTKWNRNDPFKLDGKTYSILNYMSDIQSYVMMTETVNTNRFKGVSADVTEDRLSHNGRIFVAKDTEAPEFTFHYVNKSFYYMTTVVDGETKFLKISADGLQLIDTYDESCNVTLKDGIGNTEGSLQIIGADGYHISQNGGNFTVSIDANTSKRDNYINLIEKSQLHSGDLVDYMAYEVSVSDTVNVKNGTQIILYTRVWNEDTKSYEFYAIDYDGTMRRVYEGGGVIEWSGTQVNKLLWEFTEYYEEDGVTPNYYYELQNVYSGDYIAPHFDDHTILSDEKIGLNMNGRRYGYFYTSIIAWDDPSYEYSGLTVDRTTGKIVPCKLDDALPFYFAIVTVPEEEQLSTQETVDNNLYGIKMRMVDYDGQKSGQSDLTMNSILEPDSNRANRSDRKGLVSRYLDENGYPIADNTGRSLEYLFTENPTDGVGKPINANHLFNQNIYNRSGYFEYDSTESFATLNKETGDFTVYDDLGTMDSGTSLDHGQFMPYNDIYPGIVSTTRTNTTDINDQPLSYTNPRKGEKLYRIPNQNGSSTDGEVEVTKQNGETVTIDRAHYHFAMDTEASFTMTPDGLDDWGHDIIFEFSGDDDMWFYVDGFLVLDLGGCHAAYSGKIDYKTGNITASNNRAVGDETLLKAFRNGYSEKYAHEHPDATSEEVSAATEAYLATVFKDDGNGNLTSVFKDYSTHTMKMIYMERGAGASNLHMRFNLSSVQQNVVELTKTRSGLDETSTAVAEFPYQIYYTTEQGDAPEYHLLTDTTTHNSVECNSVTYKGRSTAVRYLPSYTPEGHSVTYEHVFFLKPNETAEIHLPDDTVNYYIVECGVDTRIYNEVRENNQLLTGQQVTGEQEYYKDFPIEPAAWEDRSIVTYDNHVSDQAKKTLTIKKELYDVNHEKISDPNAKFSFRLYISDEIEGEPQPINMGRYHVKDPQGNYCIWDASIGTFSSLNKTEFSQLTEEEVIEATFITSMNGAISKIPVDYSIEVRNLLVGLHVKVEERPWEIPEGYSLWEYELDVGDGTKQTGKTPPRGVVDIEHQDPVITVRNVKGFGLTVNKVWTDKDFITERDPIYMAVYRKNTDNSLTLIGDKFDGNTTYYTMAEVNGAEEYTPVTDPVATDFDKYYVATAYDTDNNPIAYRHVEVTLRKLTNDKTRLYWYFEKLITGADFNDYVVREVTLDENHIPTVIDTDGYVWDVYEDAITPKEDNETIEVAGKLRGTTTKQNYTYTIDYQQGTIDENQSNIRTDTVTNSRPGIKIKKTDMDGNPLEDANFTLSMQDLSGSNAYTPLDFTSDETGMVTTAYLPDGTYTLSETKSPTGYLGMQNPLTITQTTVDGEKTVTVTGGDEGMYEYVPDPSDENIGTLIVKNQLYAFRIRKLGMARPEGRRLLEGVEFEIYHQVRSTTTGQLMRDYYPLSGYDNLVSNAQGVVLDPEDIGKRLEPGTYYLHEKHALARHLPLSGDICFNISDKGVVTIVEGTSGTTAADEEFDLLTEEESGRKIYQLDVYNERAKHNLRFVKVDREDITKTITGAKFDLYYLDANNNLEDTPRYTNITSDENGVLKYTPDGGQPTDLFTLEVGIYYLVETDPPTGYVKRNDPVIVNVTSTVVTYNEGTTLSQSGQGITYDSENKIYTMKISNVSNGVLPSAGGSGTVLITTLGLTLLAFAIIGYLYKYRVHA